MAEITRLLFAFPGQTTDVLPSLPPRVGPSDGRELRFACVMQCIRRHTNCRGGELALLSKLESDELLGLDFYRNWFSLRPVVSDPRSGLTYHAGALAVGLCVDFYAQVLASHRLPMEIEGRETVLWHLWSLEKAKLLACCALLGHEVLARRILSILSPEERKRTFRTEFRWTMPEPQRMEVLNSSIRLGDVAIFAIFFEMGADLDHVDGSGESIASAAARHGRIDLLDLLRRLGADLNRKDPRGYRPVDSAAKYRRIDVLYALSLMGCTYDNERVERRDAERVARPPAEIDHVANAIRRDDPYSVTALDLFLRMGARPELFAREVGRRCVDEDRQDVLEFLMRRPQFRDEVLAHSAEILGLAYDQRKTHFLFMFVHHSACLSGADPISGRTLLMKSVARRDREIATWLLNSGVQVDEETRGVGTALHMAAAFHSDMIDLLVEHGADVRRRASDCGTPLHAALLAGNHTSVARLLFHGADLGGDVPGEELWYLYHDLCNRASVSLHFAGRMSEFDARATVDRRLFEESASSSDSEPLRLLRKTLEFLAVEEDTLRISPHTHAALISRDDLSFFSPLQARENTPLPFFETPNT